MKTFVYACLVVLCAVVVAQADQLVKNGSFEYPYAYQTGGVCGTSIGPSTDWWWCIAASGFTGMEWTVEWANAPGSLGNLEFWRGTPPSPQNYPPQSGDQYVELDTNWRSSSNTNVRIHQSIATCPGADYALSYHYRSRSTDPDLAYSFGVSVLWAGGGVASHTGAFSPWVNGTASLPGKFGPAKLEFVATGSGDGQGMLLDNVSLTGPNPATPNACTSVNIKPYSDPNSINVCSSGTVPVTIWGSPTFDVTTIDPASLSLGGAMVNTVGKTARYQCSISDSGRPQPGQFDGIGLPDGYPDLTCHFETAANMFEEAATSATVSMTVCQNGFAEGCTSKPSTVVTAADAVRIVKEGCQ